jgi:two-component system sensor histidine kinase KdpD
MASRFAPVRPYFEALGYVLASTVCAAVASPYAPLADLAMIQLLGVVVLSLRFSVRVSVVACTASVLLFDFLFVPPRFAFAWTDVRGSLTFVAMLIVTYVISALHERVRAAAFRSEALYALNAELSSTSDTQQLVAITARHLGSLFNAKVTILLRSADGTLSAPPWPEDVELANRAWTRRELTRKLSRSGGSVWAPLVGAHATLGVVGLRAVDGFTREAPETILLTDCATQCASAIERAQLQQAVRQTELRAESERLRSSLLSAVSHDLKTPLASMLAAASTLLARHAELPTQTREQLLASIVSEGERLHALIQNLLSISRLESPTIELRRTPESVEEIVSATVERFRSARLVVEVPHDLPLVSAEPLLLAQVLYNLIENAARYGGPEATIYVQASARANEVVVQVADDGPGIVVEEREKVFEKFYRGTRANKSDGGVGLGLTICRAIVYAHGGTIAIRERSGGGTLVELTVPLAAPQVGAQLEQLGGAA